VERRVAARDRARACVTAASLLVSLCVGAGTPGAKPRPAAPPLPSPDSLAWKLAVVGRFGERGSGPRQLLEPRGLAVDAFAQLYVADAGMHRLVIFDRDGNWSSEAGGLGDAAGQLRRPIGVTLTGAGAVAVLDEENRRVVSYDLYGRLIGVVVELGSEAARAQHGRTRPIAVASDKGGGLYVVDADQDRVMAFDFSGRFLRSLGGYGTQPGQLRRPAGVAAGGRGDLWVAERLNARAQRFDPAGRIVTGWALPVERGDGALAMAVDDSGRVALCDEDAGRVLLFRSDGRLLAWVGGLSRPAGVAFTAPGRLVVAEAGAGRMSRLEAGPRP
jgi:DNA-binding beta-propeller fold protein YncE